MAITREKKEQIVEKVRGIVKDATTIVFANFKGLTVNEVSEMRKALKGQGIGYTVAKKSLLKRAFGEGGFKGEMPTLEGEIAVAYSQDELASARELAGFIKKFPGHLAFVGGVFGGSYVGKEEITSIAAIPGMETLRAMFAQVVNSPRQRFAVVLSKVAETKN
jgi:large subunit ribosomal protein L10